MLLVPAWNQEQDDDVIRVMVDVLIEAAAHMAPDTDMRTLTENMRAQLWCVGCSLVEVLVLLRCLYS